MYISRKNKETLIKIFSKYISRYVSNVFTILYKASLFTSRRKKIDFLLKAIRYDDNNYSALNYLFHEKKKGGFVDVLKTSKNKGFPSGRIIVLADKFEKNKKGVILIKFSDSFSKVLNCKEFDLINKNYIFVLEPSWTGYADADILKFCEKAENLIIQASFDGDRALLNTLYPHIPVIDTGSSNWVNYDKFIAKEDTFKDIDILYIANNNPIKRVYKLIKVIKKISQYRNIKCKIICAGWGGSSDEIVKYVESQNLNKFIEISPGLKRHELINEINRSKVSVLFSHKEGSNRVLFESLFCNTPIFCIKENKGVNKSYINEMTGMLAYEDNVEDTLIYMINNYSKFSARRWALENITPEVTTERIKKTINIKYPEFALESLKIKVNDPELKYKNIESIKLPESFEDLVKHL